MQNDKIVVAIGGGEIRNKTTLKIDEYVASLAKERADGRRANALFIGTASHDSMPYFNSFRKTYTSVFDIKADVALTVYGEMDYDHIAEKFARADCVYVGGGDTVYMLEKWKQTGIIDLILSAYERGVIIAGLSAGAICWFNAMYTDYEITRGVSADYKIIKGMGVLGGLMSPHYNERAKDFDKAFLNSGFDTAYAVENDCAVVFKNGIIKGCVSAGGNAYELKNEGGNLIKIKIAAVDCL